MNIIHVISTTRPSGTTSVVVLADWLEKRGHNILLVCPPGGWLPGIIRAADIPLKEIPMHGTKGPSAILQISRLAREFNADIIHAHLSRATYISHCAGILSRTPVVSSVHVMHRDLAYKILPNKRHWFVGVSDCIRKAIISHGVPEKFAHTVYNGTDFLNVNSKIMSENVREEFCLPDNSEIVGLVGNVNNFKGHPILIEAARTIIEHRPDTYFMFVGKYEPSDYDTLVSMAKKVGVSDHIRYTGVRNDVKRLISEMNIVTLPSQFEACSMAIIEAMAMGKPVVASRVGGNPELVEHERTGLLIKRNPEELSEALISLLSNKELCSRMGTAGKLKAENIFSAAATAENMEMLYIRLRKSIGYNM